jgi:hypothetical protein
MTGYTDESGHHSGMIVFDDDKKAEDFQRAVVANKVQVTLECSCGGKTYTCQNALYVKSVIPHKNRIYTFP